MLHWCDTIKISFCGNNFTEESTAFLPLALVSVVGVHFSLPPSAATSLGTTSRSRSGTAGAAGAAAVSVMRAVFLVQGRSFSCSNTRSPFVMTSPNSTAWATGCQGGGCTSPHNKQSVSVPKNKRYRQQEVASTAAEEAPSAFKARIVPRSCPDHSHERSQIMPRSCARGGHI